MTATRPRKTPGPDHPITLERSPSHVVVRSGSVVIAETDQALEMRETSYPAVLYIPLDDVDQRLLRRSERHTYCPYKGEASYYDIIDTNGNNLTAPIWEYNDPFPAVADIKGHVAFYTNRVTVTVTPRETAAESVDQSERPSAPNTTAGASGEHTAMALEAGAAALALGAVPGATSAETVPR